MQTTPSRAHFEDLARTAALVPVTRELPFDLETPLSVFGRLRGACATPFLLESVVGGERWARYSVLGLGARAHVRGTWIDDALQLRVQTMPGFALPRGFESGVLPGDGIEAIRRLLASMRSAKVAGLPRFWGGLVGVWGHDLVRSFEHLPWPSKFTPSALPVLELLLTDMVLVFDNLAQRLLLVATACPECDGGVDQSYAAACERLAATEHALLRGGSTLHGLTASRDGEAQANLASGDTSMRAAQYVAAVEQAKRHIGAGDIFQVVLSQSFRQPRDGVDVLDVYRLLRLENPAPYMYFLDLPAATLVGASPEVLVRLDADTRHITVRPIAGTRPRGVDQSDDARLEAEMLADVKERAEHLMLLDLGRNDVGRVAEAGSVRVVESFAVERYSRVMHLVSEVQGNLRASCDALDALRATFPAGTLSGAPKVRALEIIDELETSPRGWYGGAVGYIGYDGGADFAICIRSMVADARELGVRSGAGIVYDSIPEREHEECLNKAGAVLRAIAGARQQAIARAK